jgi:EAL domain-containing protein (putative c-di-GMP-specific phosphodiesterase class I)
MQTISRSEGFEIWFQPILNSKQNLFSSVEVLLRLKEKNGSFISPAEFIPIAEKTGQITDITWFVIEETCSALAGNRELDGIRVSINLPMIHLVDPTFENRLNKIVDRYKKKE